MRFSKFLKVCTPEELAEYELSLERTMNRVRADMDANEFMDHPDLAVEREIVIESIAGLRLQLATAGRNLRLAAQKEAIYKEGMEKLGQLAIKNADASDYWRKLALAYEVKLKENKS